MKTKLVVLASAIAIILALAPTVRADDYQRTGSSDHPLRLITYCLHPCGVAVEYVLLRPWHQFVSREPYNCIFGHQTTPHDKFPGWRGRKTVHNEAAYAPLYDCRRPADGSKAQAPEAPATPEGQK